MEHERTHFRLYVLDSVTGAIKTARDIFATSDAEALAQGHALYRPETKGKVERPFRYIREDFFLGGTFRDLDDLNLQFGNWLGTVANLPRRLTQHSLLSSNDRAHAL